MSIAGQNIPAFLVWQLTRANDTQTELAREGILFIKELKNLNTHASIAEQSTQVFQVWQPTLVKGIQVDQGKANILLHCNFKKDERDNFWNV